MPIEAGRAADQRHACLAKPNKARQRQAMLGSAKQCQATPSNPKQCTKMLSKAKQCQSMQIQARPSSARQSPATKFNAHECLAKPGNVKLRFKPKQNRAMSNPAVDANGRCGRGARRRDPWRVRPWRARLARPTAARGRLAPSAWSIKAKQRWSTQCQARLPAVAHATPSRHPVGRRFSGHAKVRGGLARPRGARRRPRRALRSVPATIPGPRRAIARGPNPGLLAAGAVPARLGRADGSAALLGPGGVQRPLRALRWPRRIRHRICR